MQVIEIKKDNALKAYNAASGELKVVLGNLFGKQVISQNPMDLFKSYEDVCLIEGMDPFETLPFPQPVTKAQVSSNGNYKLQMIFEAFNNRTGDEYNQFWVPDYAKKDQWKYYPYHVWDPSAGAFVYTYTLGTRTYTYLGACLCTENDDYATYIGKQFNKEWNEFLNPQI